MCAVQYVKQLLISLILLFYTGKYRKIQENKFVRLEGCVFWWLMMTSDLGYLTQIVISQTATRDCLSQNVN